MPPLIDTLLLSESEPTSIYMWPEVRPGSNRRVDDETFVFQYWPESIQDAETPRFQEREVLGASHPLVQWTGGAGREISFTAFFTAETEQLAAEGVIDAALPPLVRGTSKYTVDINGAIARIKSYIRGDYFAGGLNQAVKAPPRLWLVIPGTSLGGDATGGAILTVLKSAPVTYDAWFPSGRPRSASVALTFTEVVQRLEGDDDVSRITYIGRSSFKNVAANYNYRGNVDRARV